MSEQKWIDSYGHQKEVYQRPVTEMLQNIHNEKIQISSQIKPEDFENNSLRVSFEDLAKPKITYESSIRYKHTPKDKPLW